MDKKEYRLVVCRWQGNPHCVYLNDFRIAGGKPLGGGTTLMDWSTDLDRLIRALPELSSAHDKAAEALMFLRSVIKSGEPWTASCQDAFDEALVALRKPEA